MDCIDSPDLTIRIKALDLVQGMVSNENLVSIVGRLMRQLKLAASSGTPDRPVAAHQIEFRAEPDEDEEPVVKPARNQAPPLPEDYKFDVIGRILAMCAQNNYTNLLDFDWYIDILTQLVRTAPRPRQVEDGLDEISAAKVSASVDISEHICNELRNVAVKVKAVRSAAVRAADSIVAQLVSESPSTQPVTSKALKPASWIVSEFASEVASPDDSLGNLLLLLPRVTNPEILSPCLQSSVKLFAIVTGDERAPWTAERKARTSLLMARIIHLLEPLASHPALEVQERAVEFIELLKIATEATSGQAAPANGDHQDAPLLLTQAIPSLFQGWELNSVAPGAQRNVPLPDGLDLDEPIHPNLSKLLGEADALRLPGGEDDEFDKYYHQRPAAVSISSAEPAISRIQDVVDDEVVSYQQAGEESYLDADILARRKAERLERNRDDPFYIGGRREEGASTPIHDILKNENGNELDIDSIPIMKLDLNKPHSPSPLSSSVPSQHHSVPKPRQRLVIAADETLSASGLSTPRNYESENNSDSFTKSRTKKVKQSLLYFDSSHLGSMSLEGQADDSDAFERQQRAEAEMAQALKEVEKRRLEMQRASERIQLAQGVDVEGTIVMKKKKKKAVAEGENGTVKVKKKKKAAVPLDLDTGTGSSTVEVVKPKKKKAAKIIDLQEAGPA
jgi:AP-3 complex subunit delta